MVRKNIFIMLAIVVSSGIMGACSTQSVTTSQETVEIVEASEELRRNGMDNETNYSNEETKENKITNLMEQSTQVGVCIDYDIEDYENIQKFGYDLFGQNINNKNPVLSPVSAYLALSMAGCGAGGTTREEFYNVLGNDMMALSDDIMNTFPAEGEWLEISIANSAWIDDEFIVNDKWLGTVNSLMDADAFQAKLSDIKTTESINQWTADKTNGLIDKMLEEPLNEMTRLVLINTVYFKGKWETPFKANDTCKEDFYLNRNQNEIERVDMMNQYNTDYDYISNDFAEGIILPYLDNENNETASRLAFVAIKPTGTYNIRDVYNGLTEKVMTEMLVNKQTRTVNIKLPKFETAFDINLNKSLADMGLNECFDAEKSCFNQMGKFENGDNIYISLVRQKAKIIVDEEGTEAAAATEIEMRCAGSMQPQEVKEMYFNEPFIYMVMDMEREVPLFMGIIDNPS